ncbi:MAG: DUF6768 family protein [Maritimibacter sp.]
MDKLDELISQALSAEEQEILRHQDGFFAQNLTQFKGPGAWASWLVSAAMVIYVGLMIWCAIKMINATEVLAAIKWGIGAVASVTVIGMMKLYLSQVGQGDRLMRALKRVELLIARRDA